MKSRRHTPEQVARKLHEADNLIGQDKDVATVLRHLEISVRSLAASLAIFGRVARRSECHCAIDAL